MVKIQITRSLLPGDELLAFALANPYDSIRQPPKEAALNSALSLLRSQRSPRCRRSRRFPANANWSWP
jgi:hypothetical protein